MKGIEMVSGEMTFAQDEDSMVSGDQILTVTVQDAGAGKFFAIKTDRWAFDSIDHLVALLEQVKAAFIETDAAPSA